MGGRCGSARPTHRRGWSISAIARHTGRDRKTIRAYLNGERTAGVRAPAGPTRSHRSSTTAARLAEDPHLWATRPVRRAGSPLGFALSYPPLTRKIRTRGCGRSARRARTATGAGRTRSSSTRPGEETQWDWLELPDPPQRWGWGRRRTCWSGRWRTRASGVAVLAAVDGPAAPDRRAGPGHPRARRADPGVAVRPDGHRLPPRQRPGHRLVRRGRQALRGAGGDLPAAARQPQGRGREGQPHRRAALVAHPGRRHHRRAGAGPPGRSSAATRGDTRLRLGRRRRSTVARLAAAEPLRPAAGRPLTRPMVTEQRIGLAQALVAFRGNRYSVPPELAGARSPSPDRLRAQPHRHRHRPPGSSIARHRPRRRRHRRHGPRPRPRHRPRTGRDGRGQHRPPAPPQGTHPTRRRRPRRRRSPARCRRPDQRPPPRPPPTPTVIDLAAYERAATARTRT